MVVAASSLSVALQGFADFLDGLFDADVLVTVDTPARAGKPDPTTPNRHTLNIFAYRVAPSGVHAGLGPGDPLFLRASVLLTAFPGAGGTDADLRVLGEAIRALNGNPVIPVVLPTAIPPGAPASDFRNGPFLSYRLQCVLQAPAMEEINHIWTTQGSDLPYRLSVVYELALIPIEPLSPALPGPPVARGELVMTATSAPTPFIMFLEGGLLFAHRSLPAGTGDVVLALIGDPGPSNDAHAALTVEWTRADGAAESQPAQVFPLKTMDMASGDAAIQLTLAGAAAGDRARLTAQASDASGRAVPGAPSNILTLEITAP